MSSNIFYVFGNTTSNDEIRSWISAIIVFLVLIWAVIQMSSGYRKHGGLGSKQLEKAGNVMAPLITSFATGYLFLTATKYVHMLYQHYNGGIKKITTGMPMLYGGNLESDYFY